VQNERGASLTPLVGAPSLQEYHLHVADRKWTILHTGALLSVADELGFLGQQDRMPYGVALWPSSIALAHEVLARADAFRGTRVLELGAGTGLPGIVAASLGARVVQTDRHERALSVCMENGARNDVATIEHRLADWTDWHDGGCYDWIIGSDILYAERLHPHLRRIFESNLEPRGRVLIADPFRAVGLRLLEQMEAGGWSVVLSTWSVGDEREPRSIAVFELARP
jgi:methyltransferase-like protein 23